MDDSMGAGLMAVIAVSGSIVFLSLQVHKRLLSDFMHKIEFELGSLFMLRAEFSLNRSDIMLSDLCSQNLKILRGKLIKIILYFIIWL